MPVTEPKSPPAEVSPDVHATPADAILAEVLPSDRLPADRRRQRLIRRPNTPGNLVFLISVTLLGLWGLFLLAYVLKSRLGIDLFPGVSLSNSLGL